MRRAAPLTTSVAPVLHVQRSMPLTLEHMERKIESLALLLGLAVAGAAGATMPKPQPPMTHQAYEAAKAQLDAQYKADSKLCDPLKGHPQKVCQTEAKGRHEALRAELDARFKPSPEASQKAKTVTAEANFDVAKAKCDGFKDGAKDRCVKEAKAAREAAIRQAKVEKVQETGGAFKTGAAHRNLKLGAS